MNTSSLFRRVTVATMGIVLLVCLNSCAVARPFPLPVWETYRREILHDYDFIHRIKARLQNGRLMVSFNCSNASEQEAIQLKSELQRFFLARSSCLNMFHMKMNGCAAQELEVIKCQFPIFTFITVDGYQTLRDLS